MVDLQACLCALYHKQLIQDTIYLEHRLMADTTEQKRRQGAPDT